MNYIFIWNSSCVEFATEHILSSFIRVSCVRLSCVWTSLGFCVGRESLQGICSTIQHESMQHTLIKGTYSRVTLFNRLLLIKSN